MLLLYKCNIRDSLTINGYILEISSFEATPTELNLFSEGIKPKYRKEFLYVLGKNIPNTYSRIPFNLLVEMAHYSTESDVQIFLVNTSSSKNIIRKSLAKNKSICERAKLLLVVAGRE
jgi:hypothetical protein